MNFKALSYFAIVLVLGLVASCKSDGSKNSSSNEVTSKNNITSNTKDITTFSIGDRVGAINGTDITVAMPFGTTTTTLTPTIAITGTSINPASGIAQDFTSPVTYTVTAADGTTKVYTVTVMVAASDAKNINALTIPTQVGLTVINEAALPIPTITVILPYGAVVTSLIPTIAITGTSINPASGIAQDFTNPVTYTVTAANGTTKAYKITVTLRVPGQVSVFNGDGVTFNMMYAPGGLTFPTGTDNSGTPATVATAYWIGETGITYELWSKVRTWAIAHGYTFANAGVQGNSGGGTNQNPVTTINWRDAMVFSNALTEWNNDKNGTNDLCVYYTDAAYTTPIRVSTNSTTVTYSTPGSQDDPYVKVDATGFRLLTSNEWELAARYKGSDSAHGAIRYPAASGNYWTPGSYASGAAADYNNSTATKAVAWYGATSTQAVKLLAANTLGLYDVSGNVWNLCFNTEGPACTIRGGVWNSGGYGVQLGLVSSATVYLPENTIGFRVAKTDL